MQKSMERMNIKLRNVLSDITSKSGQDIIKAIPAGERDAKTLSELADISFKNLKEIIVQSLVGNWNDDLLFTLKQNPQVDYYRRMQSRKGPPMGAVVATANKISKIVYMMVKTKIEYNESIIQINESLYLMKKQNMQKGIAVIQKQIEAYAMVHVE
jgi:hypothetical protein